MFSAAVSTRLNTYLYSGMPPAIAVLPRMREPITTSYTPDAIIAAIAVISFVLVVRVQHHDDVGPLFQRERIAGLLVAAIAAVGRMTVGADAEPFGDRDGGVVAGVVNQQYAIDDIVRDRRMAGSQGLFRMVRGHHDDDFLTVQHARFVRSDDRVAEPRA